MVQTTLIPTAQIRANTGQIPGVPKNPRFIRDERYKALQKSIADFPAMLELRELIVFPFDGIYVTIAGNMRYRAMKDAGYKEAPCKVLPADMPPEKLREIAIKDNVPFGNDDAQELANSWDLEELKSWGMELPDWNVGETETTNGEKPGGNLAERFIIPPFSVFDTRQGYWQDRKRAWLGLGIQSELGRGGNIQRPQMAAADVGENTSATLGAIPPNQKQLYQRYRNG